MKNYCNIYSSLHGKIGCRLLTTQRSCTSKTYYEILGVSSNSTTKEIKAAYVNLCKEFHPDKRPTDTSQHKRFVQLNEAYTTLARPHSRQQYDLSLSSQHSNELHMSDELHSANNYRNSQYYQHPFDRRRYGDPYQFSRWSYSETNYNKKYESEAQHRQNKFIIVVGCLTLMVFGGIIHYAAFSVGTTFSEKKLDEKDRIISHAYMKVRQKAIHSKNKDEMNELKNRLCVTSLNSETVYDDRD